MVQRGDIRQVGVSTAVENNLVGEMLTQAVIPTVAEIADINSSVEKQKAESSLSRARNEMLVETEKWRIENQTDPNNPDAISQLEKTQTDILKRQGDGIGLLGRGSYERGSRKLANDNKNGHTIWAYNRQKKNQSIYLQDTVQKNKEAYSADGKLGNWAGVVKKITDDLPSITEKAIEAVGTVDGAEIVKDYTKDSILYALDGAIKTNPASALAAMQSPSIKEMLGEEGYQKAFDAAQTAVKSFSEKATYSNIANKIAKGSEFFIRGMNGELSPLEIEKANVTEKTKDALRAMSGYTKAETKGVGGSNIATTREGKQNKLSELEGKGVALIQGNLFKQGGKPSEAVQVASDYQDELNTSYANKEITQTDWERLSNSYTKSLTEHISEDNQAFNLGKLWMNNDIGYDQIKRHMREIKKSDSGVDKSDRNSYQALMQSNYTMALTKFAEKEGIQNINDLTLLDDRTQEAVYNGAFKEAKTRTKESFRNPFVWFKADYAKQAQNISDSLDGEDAKSIQAVVANYAKQNLETATDEDIDKFTEKSIVNKQQENRARANKEIGAWYKKRDEIFSQSRISSPKGFNGLYLGNIDLEDRPIVENKDGSFSTVRTITITDDDGMAINIPTVSNDGKIMSDEEAVSLYRSTGKHLGKFTNITAAEKNAQQLHAQQEKYYSRRRK